MHDEQTVEIARLTNRLPSEIDDMGYLDSLSLITAHYREKKSEVEFQAALHGRKFKH